jgi:hypothetical protein
LPIECGIAVLAVLVWNTFRKVIDGKANDDIKRALS